MSEKKTLNRRQALKTLAAVTGAVSLASLPAWEKPVIEVGALPAHAQNSNMAFIRVTNIDPSRDIPVSVYQAANNNDVVVEPNGIPVGTLIAGPVTINHGGTYTFTVPPVSSTSAYSVAEVTDCDNGYHVIPTCSTGAVAPQFTEIKCLAAGDVWEKDISCI